VKTIPQKQQFLTRMTSFAEELQAIQSHNDILPHYCQVQDKWQQRHGNDGQNQSWYSQD